MYCFIFIFENEKNQEGNHGKVQKKEFKTLQKMAKTLRKLEKNQEISDNKDSEAESFVEQVKDT